MVLEPPRAPFSVGRDMNTKDALHVSVAALNYLLITLLAVCLMAAGAMIARLLT